MNIFICRDSAFQRYCANVLYRCGKIDIAIIEEGSSITSSKHFSNPVKRLTMEIAWGFKKFQEERILKSNFEAFDKDLPREIVPCINSVEASELIRKLNPKIAIVHGTKIIKKSTIDYASECQWLNIHWGFSPYYRGDGIITPTALNDWAKIGVTLHSLTSEIDGGSIYAQQIMAVDFWDNFYSIGLKMSKTAAEYICEGLLDGISKNTLKPKKQDLRKGILCNSAYMKKHREYILIGYFNIKMYCLKRTSLKAIRMSLRILKQIVKVNLKGLTYNFRKNQNAVFLYHEISNNPSTFAEEHGLNVTPSNFEKQIKWISRNYRLAEPSYLLEDIPQQKKRNDIALITFDDGSSSITDFAVPILRKYGVKAILFVNGSPCLGNRFWSGLVTYLASRDLLFAEKMKEKYGVDDFFLKITELDIKENSIIAKLNTINERVEHYCGKFASIDELNNASDCLWLGNHLYDHFNAASVKPNLLRSLYRKNSEFLDGMQNGMSDIFSYPFGQPETCYNNDTDKIIKTLGAKKIFFANNKKNNSFNNTHMYRSGVSDHYSESYMRSISC